MELIKLEINSVGKPEDTITQIQINKLRRQFQSSNINIILGAAFSFGVVELLGSIESKLCCLRKKVSARTSYLKKCRRKSLI